MKEDGRVSSGGETTWSPHTVCPRLASVQTKNGEFYVFACVFLRRLSQLAASVAAPDLVVWTKLENKLAELKWLRNEEMTKLYLSGTFVLLTESVFVSVTQTDA